MKTTAILHRVLAFLVALGLAGSTALVIAADQAAVISPSISKTRDFKVEHRYLNLPIINGAPKRKVALLVDGKQVVVNDVELADSSPDWWAFIDVEVWRGRTVTVQVDGLPQNSEALALIDLDDSIKDEDRLYREPLRPMLHFSSRRGWLNDPNGLVYYNGEYHLFYQHNPYGWDWGNMHWGHATSRDLTHWQEHGDALIPDRLGPMFSGSAVVDWNNTSGFGQNGHPPLVLIYTAAGSPHTQCIAYSNDGRSFTKYANNPVVGEITPGNRDPKVFWYAPTKRWVMMIYTDVPVGAGVLNADGKPVHVNMVQFLTSPNLRVWTPTGTVAGGTGKDHFLYECPDIFELPVDGDAGVKKWVLTAATGEYAVGTFDGERFVPETPKLVANYGRSFYAAQSFSDLPDGRRIQIGWGQAPSPGMPFNQLQLLPCELRLVKTAAGPRLARTPLPELAALRDGANQSGSLVSFRGEAVEFRAEFTPSPTQRFEAEVRGAKIVYDASTQELIVNGVRAQAPLINGRQRITVFVDRTVIEAFASDGQACVAEPFIPKHDNQSVSLRSGDGFANVPSLEVYRLKSIWNVTNP